MSGRNYDKLAIAAEQNIKEKEFWLDQLSGELLKTGFPYNHQNNRQTPVEMQCLGLSFNQNLSAQLMKLSKGSDVKLHMILAAALILLLEKYTGLQDIIIGTPIYKQEVEIQFINTVLVLRNQIHEKTTFKELLLQVRETIVQAAEHQNYPLEVLLEQLGISSREQNLSLFDIVIMHQNIHDKKYLQYIHYNILFSFKRNETQEVEGILEYNPTRYEEPFISQIIHHYLELLGQVIFNVELRACDINILSEGEKQQILYDFNDTASGDPVNEVLHDLFAFQAEMTPDSIALVSEELLQDFQLTYRELDKKSNQLAHFLRGKGVKPETIVGLMVEKSQEMMVGILGILKAGGAYLPIDPAYPHSRIEYMLKESGTKILLTYNKNTLPTVIIENLANEMEIIDIFSPGIYKSDPSLLKNINRPKDTAYIIYTSGSTGKPKGVAVEHRNVVAYIHSFYREFDITAGDIALQQASYSFDAFVEEVYPVLFRGGKVALCPKYVIMDTEALARFILTHDITLISVSPLLLNEINQLPQTGSIRIFISGGDELKNEYITNLLQKKNSRVYNTYGPTEATVCASYYRCSPGNNSHPPIGKPITNYSIYILDSHQRLVPIGVAGELCIAGVGISRGYLNNPELTTRKFLPVLNRSHKSYRSYIYKTGDLARWQPEGNIEFLGRIDNQVNIRGFRIELGEIESLLLNHENIDAAIVLAKQINKNKGYGKDAAHKDLCAYIAAGEKLDITGLREYLAAHLPDHMVPSYFVFLERMPLTPHGKPDTRALDAYEPISGTGVEYVAPATAAEKTIAEIWKELLHLDKPGINDNFFDLGGNSMLLLKATNKIREVFQFKEEISFMLMFQYTTIASIAGYLDQAKAGSIEAKQKYSEQAETLNKGKDRMKKFIKKTKEVNNG